MEIFLFETISSVCICLTYTYEFRVEVNYLLKLALFLLYRFAASKRQYSILKRKRSLSAGNNEVYVLMGSSRVYILDFHIHFHSGGVERLRNLQKIKYLLITLLLLRKFPASAKSLHGQITTLITTILTRSRGNRPHLLLKKKKIIFDCQEFLAR